jgi:formylglycine-generating enzyme required for sulfatase activity
MGDPRRGVGLDANGLPDIVWVDIPAGQVTLETRAARRPSAVHAFRIARYPITWRQYRAFVDAAEGYRDPRWWDELKHEDQPGADRWAFANYPAINVSWYDAVAFCRWLSDRLGLSRATVIRLPTEWEWQWVAQAGAEAREYPWHGEWNRCALIVTKAVSAGRRRWGCIRSGLSMSWPVMDLAGNVWEWCVNEYTTLLAILRRAQTCPACCAAGRGTITRGYCRAANRSGNAPDCRGGYIGFRVCRGAPIEPLRAAPLNTVTLKR